MCYRIDCIYTGNQMVLYSATEGWGGNINMEFSSAAELGRRTPTHSLVLFAAITLLFLLCTVSFIVLLWSFTTNIRLWYVAVENMLFYVYFIVVYISTRFIHLDMDRYNVVKQLHLQKTWHFLHALAAGCVLVAYVLLGSLITHFDHHNERYASILVTIVVVAKLLQFICYYYYNVNQKQLYQQDYTPLSYTDDETTQSKLNLQY